MKKLLIGVSLLVSVSSYAKIDSNIKCFFDSWKQKSTEVKVELTMGTAPDQTIKLGEDEVSVGFFPGSEFESQQSLSMKLNDNVTTVYDPSSKSLYIVEGKGGARLQCYTDENDETAGSTEIMTLRLENCNIAKEQLEKDALEYARSKNASVLKNLQEDLELMKNECIHAGIQAEKVNAVNLLNLKD